MKTILLVDDDPIFHFLNTKILAVSKIDCDVKSVHDARLGIKMLSEGFLPDYIFLDLDMPHMDGFQFIEAFNKLSILGKEKVVIVVLTSSETVEEQRLISALGVKHYVSKPLSESKVKELIL